MQLHGPASRGHRTVSHFEGRRGRGEEKRGGTFHKISQSRIIYVGKRQIESLSIGS